MAQKAGVGWISFLATRDKGIVIATGITAKQSDLQTTEQPSEGRVYAVGQVRNLFEKQRKALEPLNILIRDLRQLVRF